MKNAKNCFECGVALGRSASMMSEGTDASDASGSTPAPMRKGRQARKISAAEMAILQQVLSEFSSAEAR